MGADGTQMPRAWMGGRRDLLRGALALPLAFASKKLGVRAGSDDRASQDDPSHRA